MLIIIEAVLKMARSLNLIINPTWTAYTDDASTQLKIAGYYIVWVGKKSFEK